MTRPCGCSKREGNVGHKIDSAYYHKKGCGDVKDPAQKGRCEGFVDQCIATLAKIGDMDKSVYQLTPEKGSPVGGMDFDRCISFAKTMSTDKKPGQVKIAPEKKEEPGKKVEPEKKVPVVKKDPPKAGAGKETGAPKIDKEYFYNKGCSTVAKKPVEYGRCKGFVDQCIGTLEKTGDRDKSVYKQVADTGVAYYKMDFDVCISRASMMSAYGPPAPQKKFDSAKPGVKVEKNPVAGGMCSASQYGPAKDGVPAWVGAKAPEYAKNCGSRYGSTKDFAIFHAKMEILKHYCGLKPKIVRTKVEKPGITYEYSSEKMVIDGPPPVFSSTGPATHVTKSLDDGEICTHIYFNWDTILCPGGKVIKCK